MWRDLLKGPGSVLTSGFPEAPLPDVKLKAMETYLTRTVKSVRDAADKAVLPPKAKKGKAPPHTPHQVGVQAMLLAPLFLLRLVLVSVEQGLCRKDVRYTGWGESLLEKVQHASSASSPSDLDSDLIQPD